jgi:hypothetical protein
MRQCLFPGRLLGIASVIAGAAALHAGCEGRAYTAGIDGSGVRIYTNGPIEAFGSIVLNGQHYDISQAQITVNGELATEASLAIGQIVSVDAIDRGADGIAANSVVFDADVVGPIESVDVANDTLVVLAQDIRIGVDTLLELGSGNDLASLLPGDLVEISGFRGWRGAINATRVARAPSGAGFRVIGRVSQLNVASFVFNIGDLSVDYSNAGLIEGFPNGGPTDGDEVLAIGQSLNGSGALIAMRLELIDDDAEEREGHEAEVEGLITRFVSPTDFDVRGLRATTTAATDYEGGSVLSLQLNVKIQIEGRFDAQGTIVASEVEVKDGGVVQQ